MAKRTNLSKLLIGLPLPIDLGYLSANYGESLTFGVFTALMLLLVFILYILGRRRRNQL